jgi:CheY-like chemotaxis protein
MNDNITKLLWVDNDLYQDLNELRTTVLLSDEFDTDFALNATEGFNLLRQNTYDLVVVDLRLPPGPHNAWEKYQNNGFEEYGYALLREVFIEKEKLFSHLQATCFGVYSIDAPEDIPQLFEAPIYLPRERYCQKTDQASNDEFMDYLQKLLESCRR